LFNSHPLVDRIALCDREPDRIRQFADQPAFRAKLRPNDIYATMDDICQSDLDALVIITQPWLHAPQTVQAMEAGKHVYSAVPVVWLPDGNEVLDWCDRIVNTCWKTGLRYMLGETTIYRGESMYCRRRAAEGAFGKFVYAEGEYYHAFDSPGCDLREVYRQRRSSASGQEWIAVEQSYRVRGIFEGPMHYPTHSVSGPMNVMRAHATKVSAWGFKPADTSDFFSGDAFSNETALFHMSNGAAMRINEYREIGYPCIETFRLFGTEGTYSDNKWLDKGNETPLAEPDMRDALPDDVEQAFRAALGNEAHGGHGGSHAFLVHEFVDAVANDRMPVINAWEAARYMAAGITAHKSALRDGELLEVPDWGDAPA
jgi:predicted dehydrogenase